MADSTLAQHSPALKVGGRRLSVSKPKPRTNGPASADVPAPAPTAAATDYPRPAPPQDLVNNEDEPPKKDKRQGHGNHDHDNEKKAQEAVYRKAEATRPTRDAIGGKSGFGGAGRVLQPGGKGFAA